MKSSPSAWSILIMATLSVVAGTLCFNTIPPIGPLLMDDWGISEAQLGLLMAVFSIAGLVLALPGSLFIQKVGPWRTGILALTLLVLGSALGLTSAFPLQLASRTVEGAGLALLALLGPTLIALSFSSGQRGMALGVFSSSGGVGQITMYNLAPLAVGHWGWSSLWLATGALALVVLVVWFVRMRPVERVHNQPEGDKSPRGPSALTNPRVVTLAVTTAFFFVAFLTLQMFLPTYLAKARGLLPGQASSLASVGPLMGTITALVAGTILDRLGRRRLVTQSCLALLVLSLATLPFLPTEWLLVPIVITGVFPTLAVINLMASATEATGPAQAPQAVGMIVLGQNVGLVAGPWLFGSIVPIVGWPTAWQVLAAFGVVAVVVLLFFATPRSQLADSASAPPPR